MLDTLDPGGSLRIPDRRRHLRQQVRSLAYVEMGEDNGGLIIDISEGGLAVQAAVALIGDHLPQIRFQLPQSENWVEAGGQIAWTGKSRKQVGVEFADLPEDARNQIRDWISSEAFPGEFRRERGAAYEGGKQLSSTPTTHEAASQLPESATLDAVVERGMKDSSLFADAATTLRSAEPPVSGSWPEVDSLGATNNSEFEPSWQSADGWMDPGAERRRWWARVALVSFLAVTSFAAGTAVGPGTLKGVLRAMQKTIWGASAPTQAVLPPSASTNAKAPPPDVAAGESGRWRAPVNNAPSPSENKKTKIPSQKQSRLLHGPILPQGAPMASAPEEEKSPPLLLNLDNPESASNSVAISTRRSIPMLPGLRVLTPRQAKSLQIGELIHRVEPVYPRDAEQQRIEGTVKLHATIARNGAVRKLELLSGPTLLVPPVMSAVREWRYQPTLFEGQPIETEEDISIVFRLPR